ncbi:hypothetical protein CBER1_07648 [Cercospora berteroae]|uniref:Enoyl reductase (ER) domain-containing protein n=1 Tax=Cercospora berteroae TaxID=357750 RepID=A0A2S6C9Z0_9PEZI|nr:hypothetical protein CBER1_07648 [Cercospora berteroae]
MKAWQFTDPSHGLELKTVPIPEPGPNQVLVQVKAAGLRHTDYNVISGLDTTFMFKRPITLGHELAGIVTRTGSSVTTLTAGDGVVAVVAAKRPFKLRDAASMPGLGYDGGFGEYVILEEHKALRIPQDISFADAALPMQLWPLMLWAQRTMQSSPRARGAGITTSDAVMSIEQGGTIVLVGLGSKECTLNTFEFVLRNVVLKGATGASPDEFHACMDLIAAGTFKTTTEEMPFDGIAAGIDRLVEGRATARLWADPSRGEERDVCRSDA